MPTVANIITIAKISQYLASNDISEGALFGSKPNPLLPTQLYVIRKSVEQRYIDEDIAGGSIPSASLTNTAEYLYAFCSGYGLTALALINSGSAVPGTTGQILYGYPISGSYTALVDGESVLPISLPTDAIVIQVVKSILQLKTSEWIYTAPNLILLNGISLSAQEVLFFLYVVPV